jgi:futalosine hydrolase
VLVPTELEAQRLALDHAPLELCGFGLAWAGAAAMHAIARHQAARVVLAGVCGSYDAEAAPIGAVVSASRVRCLGIGAGGRSPAELGFAAGDELPLEGDGGLALSVATASDSIEQADDRRRRHPQAAIEEMEGYSVAVAAMLAEVPCAMVRGVSNLAGDRDIAGWQLDRALRAVAGALDTMLAR